MADDLQTRLARIGKRSSCRLTHYGRKSGKPYVVTIWFTVDGDHINLQTMNMKRQWTRNVLANPRVSLSVGGETFEGTLQQVTEPVVMQRVTELMRKKYPISIPYLWLKKHPDGAFHMRIER